MKKTLEKHELKITIFIIVIYLLLNSICINNFGDKHYITAICNILLSLCIIIFILKNKLVSYYKLDKFPKLKPFLYFIPLLILMSVNLWTGININNSILEIICFMISMICVGFLEETIFRGFLFQMMSKDSLHQAILVTSLTFGIGHVLNLLNGAEFIPTIIQIIYAVSTGYMFAIILVKGNSLWPCIITHSVVNALSIFNIDNTVSLYIAPIILTIIPILYSVYLNKSIKEKEL